MKKTKKKLLVTLLLSTTLTVGSLAGCDNAANASPSGTLSEVQMELDRKIYFEKLEEDAREKKNAILRQVNCRVEGNKFIMGVPKDTEVFINGIYFDGDLKRYETTLNKKIEIDIPETVKKISVSMSFENLNGTETVSESFFLE